MRYNDHSNLEGRHAYLSPSKISWLRYDDEKLLHSYSRYMNSVLGTRLHKLAQDMINLGVKPENNSKTFNMYVTDCIGFGMDTEVPLYYSPFCFGTVDAIGFFQIKDGPWVLRIFDLKNGDTQTSEEQLEIYAALFCLEYSKNPYELYFDLRIYQLDDVKEFETDPDKIFQIMEVIKHSSSLLEEEKGV